MLDHDGFDRLHERVEDRQRRIEVLEAQLDAWERGGPGPHYYESGRIHPELDDQTVAP